MKLPRPTRTHARHAAAFTAGAAAVMSALILSEHVIDSAVASDDTFWAETIVFWAVLVLWLHLWDTARYLWRTVTGTTPPTPTTWLDGYATGHARGWTDRGEDYQARREAAHAETFRKFAQDES